MLDEQGHLHKAWRNEDFYEDGGFANSDFTEWGIIVLFYICVHYVDTILNRDPTLPHNFRYPSRHEDRNTAISQCSSISSVYQFYQSLYDRSIEARYTHISFPTSYFVNFVTRVYEPIRQRCRKVLNLP
jgi:hypothetical protein